MQTMECILIVLEVLESSMSRLQGKCYSLVPVFNLSDNAFRGFTLHLARRQCCYYSGSSFLTFYPFQRCMYSKHFQDCNLKCDKQYVQSRPDMVFKYQTCFHTLPSITFNLCRKAQSQQLEPTPNFYLQDPSIYLWLNKC